MVNQRGDLIQVRVNETMVKVDKDEGSIVNMSQIPSEVSALNKDLTNPPNIIHDGEIKLVEFDQMEEGIQIAYAGNYLCWTGYQKVNVLDLKTEEIRTIHLEALCQQFFDGGWRPCALSIDANEIESTVEAGWITESPINYQSVEELADYLQITIYSNQYESMSRMYNLRHQNMPAVKEMDDLEELMDPDQFVETGFKLIALSDKNTSLGKSFNKRIMNSSPL